VSAEWLMINSPPTRRLAWQCQGLLAGFKVVKQHFMKCELLAQLIPASCAQGCVRPVDKLAKSLLWQVFFVLHIF
jgi:hypothetical protein